VPVVVLGEYLCNPRPYEASSEVIADLPSALNALREAVPPGGGWDLAAWAGQGANFKVRVRAQLAEASSGRGQKSVPPHRVVEIAREVFPRQTIAAMDSGAHALAVAAFWESYEPRGCLCSSNLAASGYALPAAIVAKLTHPDRPVVAFLGDGGFLRSVADLATAAWRRIPLTAVVFVDASLCLSRIEQEQKRYAPEGVSLGTMEIPKLVEGLGGFGTEVEDEESLRSALKEAMAASLPAVIAVRIRPTGYRRMLEILRGKREER
jgi:acetolactate synthase-1/2/3 large subunit